MSISCAREPAPGFSFEMISRFPGGKLSCCCVTSPDTYNSAPSVSRHGTLPTEPRRTRIVLPHVAFAPARSCWLESYRAAPVPAAVATLPTLLGGSHHQSQREAEPGCARVAGGGSACSSDGGSDGGGDGGGDGLRSGSIHRARLDTQRSKSACLRYTWYIVHTQLGTGKCTCAMGVEASHTSHVLTHGSWAFRARHAHALLNHSLFTY